MFFSISALFEKPQSVQPKVHDYTHQQREKDYYFGKAPNETSTNDLFCMTGVGDGIQPNDCILLQQDSGSMLYRVVEIDHYSNAKNLWIALLAPAD